MRIKGIFRPSDLAGDEAQDLFGALFPGRADPEIDQDHAGLAIAAHNPQLALLLARLSRLLAVDSAFGQRPVLRELAIQTVNLHFGSTYAFETRAHADPCWLTAEMLAALPDWRASPLFDTEQRLVIEYSLAAVAGIVPPDLFQRVVAAYGDKAVVELTSIIGLWSFWAILLNAMGPGIDGSGE